MMPLGNVLPLRSSLNPYDSFVPDDVLPSEGHDFLKTKAATQQHLVHEVFIRLANLPKEGQLVVFEC